MKRLNLFLCTFTALHSKYRVVHGDSQRVIVGSTVLANISAPSVLQMFPLFF